MLFKESNIIEHFLVLAGLTVHLYEAFVFLKFLKLFFRYFSTVKYITKVGIRQNFFFEITEFSKLGSDHNLSWFVLYRMGITLQMGQLLFLLITLILYVHL